MGVKAGRDWILTVSAEKHDLDEVKEKLAKYRWVGQLEKGSKSGFQHYQLAIINDNSIRFETLQKKFGDAHIEPRQGTRQELFDYVTKDDTRVAGPWRGGDWTDTSAILRRGTEQGKRSDLSSVQEAIEEGRSYKEILLDQELSRSAAHVMQWLRETVEANREREAAGQTQEKEVIYGCESALSTKLRNDTYALFEPKEIFEVDSLTRFDAYDGQKVLVFPEFDWRCWPVDFITRLCDKYPVKLPARYSAHQLMADTIIFLSHEPLTMIYDGFLGEGRTKLFSLISQYVELFRDGTFFDLSPKRLIQEKPEIFERLFAGREPWRVVEKQNQHFLVVRSGGEGSESLPLLEEGQK